MTMHTHSATGTRTPAALYRGKVMHARLRPMTHRFSYSVLNLLIDIGRLDEADRLSPLFRINRRGLFSFHERDHGPRDGTSLLAHAQSLAASAGIDIAGGRVRLLCYPRLLGYVFNPLSVYYCEDRTGQLALLIYEVRNTFGGIHSYLCPVASGEAETGLIRQEHDKTFYVSPFIEMAMRYRFRMTAPGETVKIRILETDAAGPVLAATFCGEKSPLTTRHLLAAFLRLPLVTLKVFGGIHVEAARLWIKGAVYRPPPDKTKKPAGRFLPHRTTLPEPR